jgi:hypothetical protein
MFAPSVPWQCLTIVPRQTADTVVRIMQVVNLPPLSARKLYLDICGTKIAGRFKETSLYTVKPNLARGTHII